MATVDAGVEVRTVTAEMFTPEAWAPFGTVVAPIGHDRLPIDLYGSAVDVFTEPLESDRPVEYLITRIRNRGYEIRYLERHMHLTQTFIPLGGVPFLQVVAAADAREEDGIPAPDEVHAFFVPGDIAVQIGRGVWHEPPFPLQPEQVVLVTSHQDLTAGLKSKLNEKHEIAQLDVDKRNVRERTGFALKIELPLGG
jgi:ureidoglycolate lyase